MPRNHNNPLVLDARRSIVSAHCPNLARCLSANMEERRTLSVGGTLQIPPSQCSGCIAAPIRHPPLRGGGVSMCRVAPSTSVSVPQRPQVIFVVWPSRDRLVPDDPRSTSQPMNGRTKSRLGHRSQFQLPPPSDAHQLSARPSAKAYHASCYPGNGRRFSTILQRRRACSCCFDSGHAKGHRLRVYESLLQSRDFLRACVAAHQLSQAMLDHTSALLPCERTF